jgi:hypothetical protein
MRVHWLLASVVISTGAKAAELGTDLVEHSVDPKEADPAVTDWVEPHLALRDASVPSNGQLFLFLAGHRQLPSDYRFILQAAAKRGYWALGLRYPNSWTVADIIDATDDCTRAARMEILDGQGEAKLGVLPADSLVSRLVSALQRLARDHPAEAWGHFLVDGKPAWKSIAVAGHSFGSGEAALIAGLYPVRRAIFFSGPDDHCKKRRAPPAWMAIGATPASARYALGNIDDPSFDTQRQAWAQVGMLFKPSADRDRLATPYGNAHVLTTRALPQTGQRADAHRGTVEDAFTPLQGASPLFEGTWEYLLGP